MENLIVAIALYVLIIAVAYCPNKTTATVPAVDPAAPFNYFPEVEEPTHLETKPVVMPEPKAIATTKPAKATNLSSLLREEFAKPAIASTALPPITFAVASDLSALGIREIYKLAKGKVKGYKSMTKSCLIEALST